MTPQSNEQQNRQRNEASKQATRNIMTQVVGFVKRFSDLGFKDGPEKMESELRNMGVKMSSGYQRAVGGGQDKSITMLTYQDLRILVVRQGQGGGDPLQAVERIVFARESNVPDIGDTRDLAGLTGLETATLNNLGLQSLASKSGELVEARVFQVASSYTDPNHELGVILQNYPGFSENLGFNLERTKSSTMPRAVPSLPHNRR